MNYKVLHTFKKVFVVAVLALACTTGYAQNANLGNKAPAKPAVTKTAKQNPTTRLSSLNKPAKPAIAPEKAAYKAPANATPAPAAPVLENKVSNAPRKVDYSKLTPAQKAAIDAKKAKAADKPASLKTYSKGTAKPKATAPTAEQLRKDAINDYNEKLSRTDLDAATRADLVKKRDALINKK